jgi:hypothetical protein
MIILEFLLPKQKLLSSSWMAIKCDHPMLQMRSCAAPDANNDN